MRKTCFWQRFYISKENLDVRINEVTLKNGKIILYLQIPVFVFFFFQIYNTLNGHLGHNWQFQFRGQTHFFSYFVLFVCCIFDLCIAPLSPQYKTKKLQRFIS